MTVAPTQEKTRARLLHGRDGWWWILGKKIARLPEEGVEGGELVPAARKALEEQRFFHDEETPTYAITVLTATACNLGCWYCFQNTAAPPPGSFAPPRIAKATLSDETIGKITRFVDERMAKHGYGHLSVLLFGGEPLLNPKGCIKLLQTLGPLGLTRGEIITNGVLLKPELAQRLEEVGLRRAQITFDGNREVHDTIRTTRNGRGTFDKIVANVEGATEVTDLSWHFRVNVSHRNLETIEELIVLLGELMPSGRASLHIALIDDVGLDYDNEVGYDDDYAETLICLHRLAISLGLFVAPSEPLGDCPYCGVLGGCTGAVINADGVLYSCWENAGRPGWEVGTVDDGYAPDEEIRGRWVACDFDAKPHANPEQTRRFFDRVDAALLDDMRETGLLERWTASPLGAAPAC
jgi:uncharacterized protein